MPVLDFTEIPEAHVADGRQDSFEFFVRELVELLGMHVESGPDRGADDGRDLLIIEDRKGRLGTTRFRWLVSAKHKAHSGNSVGVADETNIADRLTQHQADGFMAVYSTVASSALARRIKDISSEKRCETEIFDRERVEGVLLSHPNAGTLVARFFPKSLAGWRARRTAPANLLSTYEPLGCFVCGKDLQVTDGGIVVFVESTEVGDATTNRDVYWVCKGPCDNKLRNKWERGGKNMTSWEDISDILTPTGYVRWLMAVLNRIWVGTEKYDEVAFERLKQFLICASQRVLRDNTPEEVVRSGQLSLTQVSPY